MGAATPGSRKNADDDLPVLLTAKNLKPFIDADLAATASKPIVYVRPEGGTAFGIEARLIPKFCDVWLKAREAKELHRSQHHIAARAEILMRGLAHVGIIALVDEATGYQDDRNRKELNRILEAYIAKELLPWTKRFPDEFYKEMFRLRGWSYNPVSVKRPQVVGHITNDVVYKRLPAGVLEELKRKNPVVSKGRRRYAHHRFLSLDVGDPHLTKHLVSVTTLMRISGSWKAFKRFLDKAHPMPGIGYQEQLFDGDGAEVE